MKLELLEDAGLLFNRGVFCLLRRSLHPRVIKMSSPHFNTITAIGGLLCYTYVLLETFTSSRIYAGGCRSVCLVGFSFNCALNNLSSSILNVIFNIPWAKDRKNRCLRLVVGVFAAFNYCH